MKQERGRPIDNEKQLQQKALLLTVAAKLLAEKSYRRITIRELAECAGVNSAMIAYYFENKEGLFIALLDEMSSQHFTTMQAVFSAKNPIKVFIQSMVTMLCKNNSLARLIHDEYISEKSPLGKAFIERFPKKMAKVLPNIILKNTNINDKTEAKFAAFSLITLIITPFIGDSVRKDAWQISDDEIKSEAWTNHIYHLFMNGYQTQNC